MSARSHTLRTRSILVALAAAAMVMAGCGGDDDEAADTTTTTESVSTDTTGSDTSDDETELPNDGGSGGSLSSEECEQLAAAFDQFDVSESLDGSSDPTAQLEEVAEQLAAAADDAPDAVAGDLRTLADVYEELAGASGDVDWEGLQSGDPSAAAGAARLGQIYADNPGFMTAAQNLSTWASENCVES